MTTPATQSRFAGFWLVMFAFALSTAAPVIAQTRMGTEERLSKERDLNSELAPNGAFSSDRVSSPVQFQAPYSENRASSSPIMGSVQVVSLAPRLAWAGLSIRNTGTTAFSGELLVEHSQGGQVTRTSMPLLLEPGEIRSELLPLPSSSYMHMSVDVAFFIGPMGLSTAADAMSACIMFAEASLEANHQAPVSYRVPGRGRSRRVGYMPQSYGNSSPAYVGEFTPAEAAKIQQSANRIVAIGPQFPGGYPEISQFYTGLDAVLAYDPKMSANSVAAMAEGIRAGGYVILLVPAEDSERQRNSIQLAKTILGDSSWTIDSLRSDIAIYSQVVLDAEKGAVLQSLVATGSTGLPLLTVAPDFEEDMTYHFDGAAPPSDPGSASTEFAYSWSNKCVTYRVGLGSVSVLLMDDSDFRTSDVYEIASFGRRLVPPPDFADLPGILNVSKSLAIPPTAAIAWILVYLVIIGPLVGIWVRKRRSAMLLPLTAAASLVAIVVTVVANFVLSAAAPNHLEVVLTWHDEQGEAQLTDQLLGVLEGRNELPIQTQRFVAPSIRQGSAHARDARFSRSPSGMSLVETGLASAQSAQVEIRSNAEGSGDRVSFRVDGDTIHNTGTVAINGGVLIAKSPRSARNYRAGIIPKIEVGQSGTLNFAYKDSSDLPLDGKVREIVASIAGVDLQESFSGLLIPTPSPIHRRGNTWAQAVVSTDQPTSKPLTITEDSSSFERYAIAVCPVTITKWPEHILNPVTRLDTAFDPPR